MGLAGLQMAIGGQAGFYVASAQPLKCLGASSQPEPVPCLTEKKRCVCVLKCEAWSQSSKRDLAAAASGGFCNPSIRAAA